MVGGWYDGGEEETPEETTNPENQEVEQEESLEDKVARLESEKEALAQREKTLLDERTIFGRRTKEAEDRQIAFERKLAEMESSIKNATYRRESVDFNGEDITDPEVLRRLIREEADERIASRIRSDDENQKLYTQDYLREIRALESDLDPELSSVIDKNLEAIKEYHTGNPKMDAKINFLEAKALALDSMVRETRKPVKLKQDSVQGAGVGGKGNSDTGKQKAVKLGEEEKKLLSKLGKDDKWASKVLG